MTDNRPEPRTEAGRRLLKGRAPSLDDTSPEAGDRWADYNDLEAAILAIEDEAAALVNPRLVPMLDRAAAPPEPPPLDENATLLRRLDEWDDDTDPGPLIRWAAAVIRGAAAPDRLPSVEAWQAFRAAFYRRFASWDGECEHGFGPPATLCTNPASQCADKAFAEAWDALASLHEGTQENDDAS